MTRRRHPAEVTAERLAGARERWADLFEGDELDALSVVRDALQEIADGVRRADEEEEPRCR